MDSISALTLASTLSCVALGLVLLRRPEPTPLARTYLLLLVALAVCSGGFGAFHVGETIAARGAAVRVALLGMFAASGLWLQLALRYRWPRRSGGAGATALALTPAALFFVAALTNSNHGLAFAPDPHGDPSHPGWAGPIVYAIAACCVATGFAGTGLFAHAAARLWLREERRPALGIWLALLAMPVATVAAVSEIVFHATAVNAAQILAALALPLTLLRHSLLEPPPIGHRQVIDHLRYGVLMANEVGEVLDHNAAAERLLGAVPRGRSIADAVALLAPPARRGVVRELCEASASGEPRQVHLESADGRHLEVSTWQIRSEDGQALGRAALLRDRTDELRYAQAALRAQQLETVGTLAAGIAHEVNNPLAFVRANLGEIARWGESVDARRGAGSKLAEDLAELGELAQESLEGIGRIERAVSDVRRLAAEPSAGGDVVSLVHVVEEAVRLAELRAERDVPVDTRLAPDLPVFTGSRQLLVQAVLNLLIHAQAALDGVAEPRIELETGADADSLWVRVAYASPADGIDPYDAAAADRSVRGLALSVAADIARDHGGSLRIDDAEGGVSLLLRVARAAEA